MTLRTLAVCAVFSMLPAIATAQTSPRTHELKASPTTVHRGFFDATLKPVLTIDSGDVVRLETASGNPRFFESLGVPKDKIPAELYAVFDGVEGTNRGDHTLNGPIAIRGAEPGDVLEIRIRSVDVRLPIAGQSFVPNRGLLPEDFPYEKARALWIDLDKQDGRIRPGCARAGETVLGRHRRRAAGKHGTRAERPPEHLRWKPGQSRSRGGQHAVPACPRIGRAALVWRRPRRAGPWRSPPVRDRNVAER